MSEIYRVPPWIMLEHWELTHEPTDKPNTFTVTIFSPNDGGGYWEHNGKGVSISHAAKNAYRKRQKELNEKSISAKGPILPSENKTEADQPTEV